MSNDDPKRLAIRARTKLNRAIAKGELTRPTICELCGIDSTRPYRTFTDGKGNKHEWKTRIVAHHWKGYEYPFEVWFICDGCNRKLTGRHDGSLTKEEARKLCTPGRHEIWGYWTDLV